MTEENTTPEAGVKIEVDREKYVPARAASGAKSLHNGDTVAGLLAGLSIDTVHAVGSECLDIDTAEKYGHLNVGMQRMNVGNKLRGWVNVKQKVAEGESEVDRMAFLKEVAQPHIEAAEKAAEEAAKAKAAAEAEKAEKAAEAEDAA